MKLLLLVTVCFSAVAAADSSDYNTDPEGPDTSGEDDLYPYRNVIPFDGPDDHTFATEGQYSASGQEIQDSVEQDYEDNVDVHQQIGDMSALLGRARRCRKSLGGRCQHKKYPCGKGYNKASPNGRPFCMSKDRKCCYPGPKTIAAPTTTPPVTAPAPTTTTTTAKACSISQGEFLIGKQCFKMNSNLMGWTSARSYCTGLGLDLAQPMDLSLVKKYMYGKGWISSSDAWIGARGTGSCYQWLNGTCIPNASSLWGWGPDGTKSSIYAVTIHNSDPSAYYKGKPIDVDLKTDNHVVLCERK